MANPIALQLYSVRDDLTQDFDGTLQRIADMGFRAVEATMAQANRLPRSAEQLRDLGLTVCALHGPNPVGDEEQWALESMAAFGCKYLVVPWIDPSEFATVDSIRAVCERLNAGSRVAQSHGLTLAYHNHWFEPEPRPDLAGRTPLDLMLDQLDPAVMLELDVYWAKTGGSDPVALTRRLGKRAPLVHLKDGPADNIDAPMTPLGEGVIDVRGVVEASSAEWLIVELDRTAGDMLEAVEQSYQYMVREGLGS